MKAPDTLIEKRPADGAEFYVDDWLWTKMIPLRAGEIAEQHVHEFDHPTIVASGAIRVWVDEEYKGLVAAPNIIVIKARQKHKFRAISDTVICCVHNLHGKGYPAIAGEID